MFLFFLKHASLLRKLPVLMEECGGMMEKDIAVRSVGGLKSISFATDLSTSSGAGATLADGLWEM